MTILVFGNKRGNEDIIFNPIYIISFIIVVLIAGTVIYYITDFANNDADTDANTKSVMTDLLNKYTATIDYAVLLVFFVIVIGAIISAYFIRSNVLFFIGGFIFWMLTWVLLPFLVNIGWVVMDHSIILQFSQNLPKTRLFLDNYVLASLLSGAIILLATFAKRGNINGGTSGGQQDAFG